jgi:hypothetical protein
MQIPEIGDACAEEAEEAYRKVIEALKALKAAGVDMEWDVDDRKGSIWPSREVDRDGEEE